MNTLAAAITDNATTTQTENGAVTYSTSLDPLVDMFFIIGAKRGASYDQIVAVVKPAFEVDPEMATRIALWVRDIRGGAGERQVFRHIIRFMLNNGYQDYARRIIANTLNVGRADDLFEFLGSDATSFETLKFIEQQLKAGNGLVAKWLPRQGPIAARIRGFLRLSAKQYRQLLVKLTNVVESQMCANQWNEINYSHVPSVAMKNYNKAFGRHDQVRFANYIDSVRTGKVNADTGEVEKINTGAVYPYQVISIKDRDVADTMWNNLPNFVPDNISFLPMIDTSGSMRSPAGKSKTTCMDVAISLGIYLAERNKSAFNNLYLNFSGNPKFGRIYGSDIHQKVNRLDYHNWDQSTNLEAAMRLIVNTAVDNNVPAEDMPNYLLVLSDMEFNSWGNRGPGKMTRELFEAAGYKMPNIVWWNIQSRNNIVPVRSNEQGMALVSGFSPTIVENLLAGEITPWKIMINTIMKSRYNF